MSRSADLFLLRPWLIGLIYGVAATVTIVMTRFDGGLAHLWVATAVLLAELTIAPRTRWLPTLVACGIASFVATAVFGFGLAAAAPLVAINLSEALIGALLLERLMRGGGYLESIASVAFFVLAAGAAGPMLTGFAGAAVSAWACGAGYWQSWTGWVVGHGLGMIRVLRNGFGERMQAAEAEGRELEERKALFAAASLKAAAFDGDVENGKVEAGQSAGLVDEILPAADIVAAIARAYAAALAALLRLGDPACRLADIVGRHASDFRCLLGRHAVALDGGLEIGQGGGMGAIGRCALGIGRDGADRDEILVDPALVGNLGEDRVEQREVRAGLDR